MARLALVLVVLGGTALPAATALPSPSAPHKDLDAHLGACRASFGGVAFALCRAAAGSGMPLHRGEHLTMRLTGGARQANGTTGYTTKYGMVQALLSGGRPFAAGEGVVVTGTIHRGTDVAVSFGDRQFRGSAVWHLRRDGHRVQVTIPHGAREARLTLDGRVLGPTFGIAPGIRLQNADVASRFAADRDEFLQVLRDGGDACPYLDEAVVAKMSNAQCAQFSRQLAKGLSALSPTDELDATFWDYNGSILASAKPRHPTPSVDDRELWKLEHGRFRVLVG